MKPAAIEHLHLILGKAAELVAEVRAANAADGSNPVAKKNQLQEAKQRQASRRFESEVAEASQHGTKAPAMLRHGLRMPPLRECELLHLRLQRMMQNTFDAGQAPAEQLRAVRRELQTEVKWPQPLFEAVRVLLCKGVMMGVQQVRQSNPKAPIEPAVLSPTERRLFIDSDLR